MKPTYNYINGKYLTSDKAKISVLDIGLIRGYGIFDFLVTYHNRPFLINEHINRLYNSAKMIDLNIGVNKAEMKKIILKLIKINTHLKEKTLRIIITGGVGINSLIASKKSSIIVIVQKKHNYPKDFYKNGVKIITYNYVRPMSLAKTTNYAEAVMALKIAHAKKAVEALYVNKDNNFISEATTSNIFLIKNKKLFTPKDNLLMGITRDLIINLQKNINPVYEKNIKINELLSADEVFMTASNKEVMPVVKIDDKKIGIGEVGPVTKSVIKTFKNYIIRGVW